MDSCNRNCAIKVRAIVGHLEEIMYRIICTPNWRRAVLAVASAVGLLGISHTATAEDWYVEAGFGQSEVSDFGCGSPLFPTCSADDTDSSYSIHGGYRFHENIAVEFGYTYLGFAEADGTVNLPPVVPFNAEFESWAYDVTAVGTWPVSERISVFGRIGLASWKRETDIFIGGGGGFTSMSDSGTDPVYGFGAEFAAHERVAVRLQWQRFLDVGGDDTGESDIDVISVNAVIPLRKTRQAKQESTYSGRPAAASVTEPSQPLTLQKDTTGPTNADAQFKLGHAYSIGQGVSKDYAEALKWYRAAASQGHARAQFNLGAAYVNGTGVKADKETAMDWFFKAGQSFVSEGKRDLALRVVNTMQRVVPGHPLSTQLQAAILTQFGQ